MYANSFLYSLLLVFFMLNNELKDNLELIVSKGTSIDGPETLEELEKDYFHVMDVEVIYVGNAPLLDRVLTLKSSVIAETKSGNEVIKKGYFAYGQSDDMDGAVFSVYVPEVDAKPWYPNKKMEILGDRFAGYLNRNGYGLPPRAVKFIE